MPSSTRPLVRGVQGLLLVLLSTLCGGSAVLPMRLGDRMSEIMASMKDTAAPGALGRFASVLALHPLDTLKTRAQVVSSASRRTAETAVYRSPGVFGGAAPAIGGQVVNAMLTCVGYELWKGWSKEFAPVSDAAFSYTICCQHASPFKACEQTCVDAECMRMVRT